MPPDNQPADTPVGFVGSDPSKFDHCVPATWLFNGSYANIQSPAGTATPDKLAVTALEVLFTTTSSGTPTLVGVVAPPLSNVYGLESCWVLSKQYPEVDPFPLPGPRTVADSEALPVLPPQPPP